MTILSFYSQMTSCKYDLKVQSPVSKFSLLSYLKNHHSKDENLKFKLEKVRFGKMKKFCILRLLVSYCVNLIMVTIIARQILLISLTEQLSAVKLEFPNIKQKRIKIELGSFNKVKATWFNLQKTTPDWFILLIYKWSFGDLKYLGIIKPNEYW